MLVTSRDKGKENELNLSSIYEDEDLDEMKGLDNGKFPNIDTLDEDDGDIGEDWI